MNILKSPEHDLQRAITRVFLVTISIPQNPELISVQYFFLNMDLIPIE